MAPSLSHEPNDHHQPSNPATVPQLTVPMLYSKIHRATVTAADLHYEGSLTIDTDLMAASNMVPFQKIEVYNVTNGSRYQTYAIEGPAGSGVIQANGAAAHHSNIGDLVIIAAYCELPHAEAATWEPAIVLVDANNKAKSLLPI